MSDYLALFGFVFFGLFSPGPNVILITTSGARFGFGHTVPHIIGVALGVGVIAAAAGAGVGLIITALPGLELALKVIAAFWIIWMAIRLWQSDPANSQTCDRPFTLMQAILFQWINPKVWAVAFSATAYVTAMPPVQQAITLALSFSAINLCVCLFWAGAGSFLAALLDRPAIWRMFMRVMAAALVLFSLLLFL